MKTHKNNAVLPQPFNMTTRKKKPITTDQVLPVTKVSTKNTGSMLQLDFNKSCKVHLIREDFIFSQQKNLFCNLLLRIPAKAKNDPKFSMVCKVHVIRINITSRNENVSENLLQPVKNKTKEKEKLSDDLDPKRVISNKSSAFREPLHLGSDGKLSMICKVHIPHIVKNNLQNSQNKRSVKKQVKIPAKERNQEINITNSTHLINNILSQEDSLRENPNIIVINDDSYVKNDPKFNVVCKVHENDVSSLNNVEKGLTNFKNTLVNNNSCIDNDPKFNMQCKVHLFRLHNVCAQLEEAKETLKDQKHVSGNNVNGECSSNRKKELPANSIENCIQVSENERSNIFNEKEALPTKAIAEELFNLPEVEKNITEHVVVDNQNHIENKQHKVQFIETECENQTGKSAPLKQNNNSCGLKCDHLKKCASSRRNNKTKCLNKACDNINNKKEKPSPRDRKAKNVIEGIPKNIVEKCRDKMPVYNHPVPNVIRNKKSDLYEFEAEFESESQNVKNTKKKPRKIRAHKKREAHKNLVYDEYIKEIVDKLSQKINSNKIIAKVINKPAVKLNGIIPKKSVRIQAKSEKAKAARMQKLEIKKKSVKVIESDLAKSKPITRKREIADKRSRMNEEKKDDIFKSNNEIIGKNKLPEMNRIPVHVDNIKPSEITHINEHVNKSDSVGTKIIYHDPCEKELSILRPNSECSERYCDSPSFSEDENLSDDPYFGFHSEEEIIKTSSKYVQTQVESPNRARNRHPHPWRFAPNNISHNPHFLRLNNTGLPVMNQNPILDHTFEDNISLHHPVQNKSKETLKTSPRNEPVQKSILNYIKTDHPDKNKENVKRLSIFDIEDFSPIKIDKSLPTANNNGIKRRVFGDIGNNIIVHSVHIVSTPKRNNYIDNLQTPDLSMIRIDDNDNLPFLNKISDVSTINRDVHKLKPIQEDVAHSLSPVRENVESQSSMKSKKQRKKLSLNKESKESDSFVGFSATAQDTARKLYDRIQNLLKQRNLIILGYNKNNYKNDPSKKNPYVSLINIFPKQVINSNDSLEPLNMISKQNFVSNTALEPSNNLEHDSFLYLGSSTSHTTKSIDKQDSHDKNTCINNINTTSAQDLNVDAKSKHVNVVSKQNLNSDDSLKLIHNSDDDHLLGYTPSSQPIAKSIGDKVGHDLEKQEAMFRGMKKNCDTQESCDTYFGFNSIVSDNDTFDDGRKTDERPFRLSLNKYKRRNRLKEIPKEDVKTPENQNDSKSDSADDSFVVPTPIPENEPLKVGLFDEIEPEPLKNTYPAKRRRRRLPSVQSDDGEDHENHRKKRKDQMTKAEQEEFNKWAARFNLMCEEVDKYELEVE